MCFSSVGPNAQIKSIIWSRQIRIALRWHMTQKSRLSSIVSAMRVIWAKKTVSVEYCKAKALWGTSSNRRQTTKVHIKSKKMRPSSSKTSWECPNVADLSLSTRSTRSYCQIRFSPENTESFLQKLQSAKRRKSKPKFYIKRKSQWNMSQNLMMKFNRKTQRIFQMT